MSKKKISITVDEELFKKIEKKTKQLGLSKSAFIAFSTSFFLHQLETTEKSVGKYSVNVYELIKNNLESQYDSND